MCTCIHTYICVCTMCMYVYTETQANTRKQTHTHTHTNKTNKTSNPLGQKTKARGILWAPLYPPSPPEKLNKEIKN